MDEFSKSPDELARDESEQNPAGELPPQPETKNTVVLSKPTRELAEKLLANVGFFEYLPAQSALQMPGVKIVYIRNIEEAISFLLSCNKEYSLEEFSQKGSDVASNFIDLNSLKKWVGETLGDTELAEAIKTELGEGVSSREIIEIGKYFRKHIGPVRELLEQRLAQCKEIAGEETGV